MNIAKDNTMVLNLEFIKVLINNNLFYKYIINRKKELYTNYLGRQLFFYV